MPEARTRRLRFDGRTLAVTCSAFWAVGAIALAGFAVTPGGSAVLSRFAGGDGRYGDHVILAQETMEGTGPDASGTPCDPAAVQAFPTFPPIPTFPPVPAVPAVPTPAPAEPGTADTQLQATFRLCGGTDAATARAIEQLVAGRGFSARLTGRSDGCADLAIAIQPSGGGGRQSSTLSVAGGSTNGAPGQRVAVQIVSENGATQVTIS